MRYTIGDALRHPTWLSGWWAELPARRRWWWRQVLFQPGAGWLCWGTRNVDDYEYLPGIGHVPAGWFTIAPPARRLAGYLWWWARVPWLMLAHRLSFEEARPSFSDVYWTDDERKRLWR